MYIVCEARLADEFFKQSNMEEEHAITMQN